MYVSYAQKDAQMKTNRQFADRITYNKFLDGIKEVLDENQLRKVRLLRLSIKTNKKGKNSIESIWGYVGRKLMAKFVVSITKLSNEITIEDWNNYGRLTAQDFKEWASTEEELNTLDRKYEALQFDIWKTTSDWDLAQDLINDVEVEFSTHINGRFHWLVRKALTENIAELMVRIRKDHETALSRKENLDLLKEIIQKSSITLKTSSPKQNKVNESV
jgi:hypothetical protein